jgi:ABC-type hemin transport system substrate-binding protein
LVTRQSCRDIGANADLNAQAAIDHTAYKLAKRIYSSKASREFRFGPWNLPDEG